jgi:inosine-uridine nucleoside N-ribohydrolase
MHRIILDTDPGIDDALALFLALASPEIQLEAITTVSGNVHVDLTSYNALTLLEVMERTDIPVAKGSSQPLIRTPIDAGYFHGSNGLGEIILPKPQKAVVAQSAVNLMVERVIGAPGEITIVAIAPLTNLALALRCEPNIVHAVREVLIMGGALKVRGNVTPAAEFNILADPHAAHMVLHAGWPIRLVPLDVTQQVCLWKEDIVRLRQTGTPHAELITQITDHYFDHFASPRGINAFAMNDPLCLAAVFRPDFLTWESTYVAVELTGTHTLGETVAYFNDYDLPSPRPPNVRAAVRVDASGFLQWYFERMGSY